jgi:hypothetical protein
MSSEYDTVGRPEFDFFHADKFDKIGNITDSQGVNYDVYHGDTLAFCPAVALFLRVSAECYERKLGGPYLSLGNNRRMLWAQHASTVVGGICYEYEQESRVGAIILGFVREDLRGRNIYGQMHMIFEDEIRRIGGVRIYAQIHADSKSQIRSLEKAGLTPYYLRLQQWITD